MIQSKPPLDQWSILMSSKLEPLIWSHGTGQGPMDWCNFLWKIHMCLLILFQIALGIIWQPILIFHVIICSFNLDSSFSSSHISTPLFCATTVHVCYHTFCLGTVARVPVFKSKPMLQCKCKLPVTDLILLFFVLFRREIPVFHSIPPLVIY